MNRRDVMKLGAVAAGATVGAPGCAVPRMLGTLRGGDGAAAFNEMLDEQLARLDKPGFLQRLVTAETKRPLSAEAEAKIAEKDVLFRRMLGTLLITQGFRELPEETQLETAVQTRMWSHIDQIGSSVFEMSDMLAALEPDQRKHIQQRLRDNPDLPMALGETLDDRAAKVGMSNSRRRQLRNMMTQSSFRLRHGDPASIIDEYVGKVERMRESSTRDGAALDLSKRLGEREFWRYQHLLADDPGQPATAGSATGGPATGTPGPATRAPSAGGSASGTPGPATGVASPDPTVVPEPQLAPPSGPAPFEPKVPMARTLRDAARNAARRGDCGSIEIIGKRVRELDPDYYELVFKPDPVITSCRQGVAKPVPVRRHAAEPAAPVEPTAHPGSGGLSAGGYMLGIGFLTGIGGAVLVGIGAESGVAVVGVIGLTVAVILVGLGLITLLISALIYAAND
ncbi:MAG: hypothetical protein JWO36_6802 [Myxococcales bacterium]|nr:hypothetical protein [Myxococcales bacterium]